MLADAEKAKIAHDDVPNLAAIEGAVLTAAPPAEEQPIIRQWLVDWWAGVTGGSDYERQRRLASDAEANAIFAGRAINPSLVPDANATPEQIADVNDRAWEATRQAAHGESQVPQMFAERAIQAATLGLVAPVVPTKPHSWQASMAGGLGTLAGFIGGPAAIAGAALKAVPTMGALASAAGEAWVTGLAKNVVRQAATLGLASGLEQAGTAALDTGSIGDAAGRVGTVAAAGAATGATFGAAGKVLPDNTILQWIGRTLGTSAAQDALDGTSPWDNRPPEDKIFGYALNALFSMHGAGRTTGNWFTSRPEVLQGFTDAEKARRAETSYQALATLNGLAADSKTRARDPETFQRFVGDAAGDGPARQVFIDANALMQSGVGEQVAALSPTIAEQLPDALRTGGQVAIPLDEYAARIAPTEYAAPLLDHLKTDPEGFSRAEAQAFLQGGQAEELNATMERLLVEKEGDALFRRSTETVRAGFKDQLDTTGRFTPQVNDAYSTFMGNFYAVNAARLGIMPEELYQRLPLKVVAEMPEDGRRFAQGENGPFGPVFTEFKGDARGAVAKLMETKSGEAVGALHHPDIGDIDLVWGEAGDPAKDYQGGYGLAHIAAKHPEMLGDLQGLLSGMTVAKRTANRVNLESADHRAAVRLTWDDQAKQWLLTAFVKEDAKDGGVPRTDTNAETRRDGSPDAHPSDDSIDQTLRDFHQGEGYSPRGAYAPDTLTISLLEGADLSTFLHESGHFFLDALERLAVDPAAPAGIKEDVDAALRWIGVAGETSDARLAAWRRMSSEEKRPGHEKWARGFEAYLFEGKAPSIELHSLFQRFRAWLLNVYHSLTNLNVELTPEVRGVFDRMLAAGEDIALAEHGRSMMPLFATAEQAGMTPQEFAAYQSLGVDATNDAIQDLQARGLRDMRWMHNARGRIIKHLQEEAKARRDEVRREVADEVNAQPIYRADRFLRYGELETPPDASKDERRAAAETGLSATKLSLPALKEMYGEAENAIWRYLPTGKHGLAATEGLPPDVVAEMFGFTSGDELVRKLLAATPRKEEIEALTDARMFERHGDLNSPEAIERAADAAVHNDARARFVATEANALAKAVGGRKILAAAAKEYAAAIVARKRLRDLRPGQYANAEAKAARNAEKAMKSGDLATAAAEKRNQLVQNYAARAAHDAQDEVRRGLDYLNKFSGDIKGLDADYADQIGNLLERFDLRQRSDKAVDRRTALADWLKSQREAGLEPDIPPTLENEAFRTSYRNLTVEEFRGIVDSVKQIEHLGRLKHRLLTAADQRAYEAVRDEIAGGVREHAQGRAADTRTPTTDLGRAARGLKRFWASHIKAATWARILDGGRDGGPMWEYLVRLANERGDQEATMRAEATAKLSEILAPVFKLGRMGGKGHFFPTIGRSLNREARLAVALNTGNEGNIQRLLDGEGWTMDQLTPVLQSLTAPEWRAVQAVWDHFENYRPRIAAKERRVYGREPDWVEPRSFTVTTADGTTMDMRGGYYPIKYDPAASQRAEEHTDAESAKRQLQGAYTSATTRRSFTKSRVEEVRGRPLLYTLSGLYSGVNDVIHDLAWHEWLIDANKLLRSHTIDQAVREHYGPEVKRQFKSWAAYIAEGEKGADAAVDMALSRLRQGISASGLGFNVMSAIMQPLGLTQSIVRVGASWVGRGVLKYLAHPIDLTREVNAKSDFMLNRVRTRFREFNELRNQVQDQSAFKEVTGRYAYFLMMRCQQMVDVPTWWGAYEKAISEGNEEKRAVALADQAVIDAQGGGQVKDLSAIERGGPAQKLFTTFYSFMNTALNIGVERTMSADTPAKRAKLAADCALIYVVPAVLGYVVKNALIPGDTDDDGEKLAKKLIGSQIDYLMGLMVVVREFGEAAKTVAGADGQDYTGPAGVRLISDAGKFAVQAHQGEFDDAFRKASVNLLGDLFGLPGAQINRTITGAEALGKGKTNNPTALAFGFQEKRR